MIEFDRLENIKDLAEYCEKYQRKCKNNKGDFEYKRTDVNGAFYKDDCTYLTNGHFLIIFADEIPNLKMATKPKNMNFNPVLKPNRNAKWKIFDYDIDHFETALNDDKDTLLIFNTNYQNVGYSLKYIIKLLKCLENLVFYDIIEIGGKEILYLSDDDTLCLVLPKKIDYKEISNGKV